MDTTLYHFQANLSWNVFYLFAKKYRHMCIVLEELDALMSVKFIKSERKNILLGVRIT